MAWMVSKPVEHCIGRIDDIYWRWFAEKLLTPIDNIKAVSRIDGIYCFDLNDNQCLEILTNIRNDLHANKIISLNDQVITQDVIVETQNLLAKIVAIANANKDSGTFQGLNPELDTGMQAWSTKGPIK